MYSECNEFQASCTIFKTNIHWWTADVFVWKCVFLSKKKKSKNHIEALLLKFLIFEKHIGSHQQDDTEGR